MFLLINEIVHQLLSSFDLRPVGGSEIDGRLIDRILGSVCSLFGGLMAVSSLYL